MRFVLPALLALAILPAAPLQAQSNATANVTVQVTIPPIAEIRSIAPWVYEPTTVCCVMRTEVEVDANTSYQLLLGAEQEGLALIVDDQERALEPDVAVAIRGTRQQRRHTIRVRIPREAADEPVFLDVRIMAL